MGFPYWKGEPQVGLTPSDNLLDAALDGLGAL